MNSKILPGYWLLSAASVASLSVCTSFLWRMPAFAQGANANGDYASLHKLFEGKQYKDVLAGADKLMATTAKSGSDYARLCALAAASAQKCQSLASVLAYAKAGYGAAPDNAVCATNYGAVEMVVGDRQLASQLFTKAIAEDDRDFDAHLGLSEVLALDPAQGTLKASEQLTKAQSLAVTPAQWLSLGDHYLAFNEPLAALSTYNSAEAALAAVNDDDEKKDLTGRLNLATYRAALEADKASLAEQRLSAALAVPTWRSDLYTLTIAKLCNGGNVAVEKEGQTAASALGQKIYDRALAQAGDNDELFYSMGRAFDKVGLKNLAKLSLTRAHQQDPGDGKFAVALAGFLSETNQNVAAQNLLSGMAAKIKASEPTAEKQMALGLSRAGIAMLTRFQNDWALTVRNTWRSRPVPLYKTAYADLQNIKCHCRLLTMQQTLRQQPGVIYAYIPDEKTPVAFLIYDSKVVQPAKVWQSLGTEASAKMLDRSENFTSFSQLVQSALDYAEAPYKPQTPYYVFNPMPLRLL
jgi:hypothetical protein